MPEYKFSFRVNSTLQPISKEQIRFNINYGKVKCDFTWREDLTVYVIDVYWIEGRDYIDAGHLAIDLLNPVLDALSFVTKSEINIEGLPLMVQKNQKGRSKREVLVIKPEYHAPTIVPRKDTLDAATDILKKNSNTREGSGTFLALHWLRRGFATDSVLERFMFYWLALENLFSRSMKSTFCQPCKIEVRCPICDKTPTHESSDINNIVESLGAKGKRVRQLKSLRSKVFHGLKKPDAKLIKQLRPWIVQMEKLIEALLEERLDPIRRVPVAEPIQIRQRRDMHFFLRINVSQAEIALASLSDSTLSKVWEFTHENFNNEEEVMHLGPEILVGW